MKKITDTLISVDDALQKILSEVRKLSTEDISISDARNRILAIDLASRVTQPPTSVSAMDGYAVSVDDLATTPTSLTQIGVSAAGNGFKAKIKAGQTVRIFTGAPVPDGANAIIIQEDVEKSGDQVIVSNPVPIGKYIRPAGLDFKKDDVLLTAGTRLNYRNLALAAAMNLPWLKVIRKPRVAILSTGDELVLPGEARGSEQIISSNNIGLAALVAAEGGLPINLGIAKDNPDVIKDIISKISGIDMLVTIGGASVGDYDLIKSVLSEEGLNIIFSRVAMRPGKPLIFGMLSGFPMLGLPGNPVSAGITAALFLKPAMNKMLGAEVTSHVTETATIGCDLNPNDKRQDYLRATVSIGKMGETIATPFDKQDSSMLATFAKAQCLVIRPPFAAALSAGQPAEIIRLDNFY